jgi:hypothetical protein
MTSPEDIGTRLAEFLSQEIEWALDNGRITVLTPVEYPDCDAVAVFMEEQPDGVFVLTDGAEADSRLIGFLGERSARKKAEMIAERFDVQFVRGRVIARVDHDSLPEACWRVAQASAAIAEGASFLTPVPTPRPTFSELLWDALRQRVDSVERNKPLRGLSGHEHRATIFVPATEAVLEPIAGRKAWDRATNVYAEFGDLRQANGYRLVAVLDESSIADYEHLVKLLSQVGQVASWAQHDEWLETIIRR